MYGCESISNSLFSFCNLADYLKVLLPTVFFNPGCIALNTVAVI